MDTDDIAHGNSQHPVGVRVPKFLLFRERQRLQILDGPDVTGAVQFLRPVRPSRLTEDGSVDR